MKKFNRKVHQTMGSLPPQLFKYVGDKSIGAATHEFNAFMTRIAGDFHAGLAADLAPEQIKLMASPLFGQPVTLDYVASGSVGSVYRIRIGDDTFAFKINRRSAFGELNVMPRARGVRNLINKMYMGGVFEYDGRDYSWVISDYIADDKQDGFSQAMEKLYYAYLTRGTNITDAHVNNFKNGKLIDPASYTGRDGEIDDIRQLTRGEIDIVKKLAYCIRTDDLARFERLVARVTVEHPRVIDYMFWAMKFGKIPFFGPHSTDPFAARLKKFDAVIHAARPARYPPHALIAKLNAPRAK